MSVSRVLGVDGGNSKTVAIVAAADGTVLGAGRAGGSDIYNATDEMAALAEIRRAVEDALAAAHCAAGEIAAAAFSLAGADWPEDYTLLRRAVDAFGFGETTTVVNDAIGALRAGTRDGVGVALACGTGIAIGARNGNGETWYSGHWPIASGGFEMGLQALHAVFDAHLRLGPETSLTPAMLSYFNEATVEGILKRCTERGTAWTSRPQQARLAPVLLDEAARGDDLALAIVRRVAERNANAIHVAARAVGLDRGCFPIVLTGGVLRHPSGLLEQEIGARAQNLMPAAQIVRDAPEPVVGAILLALDALGEPADAATVVRLKATLPDEGLFDTCARSR